jgi:hypothetical protein
MSKSFENHSSKPNKPHSKPQFSLDDYRQLPARQNTPPRYNEGGSR